MFLLLYLSFCVHFLPGFNFGRPYVHPYQYMQYPGFVFPHTPIYPLDHRRMFEPRFYAPAWADTPRRQHQPQPHGRRETACSEAQTEPSDAISKLIECLDKIRVGELHGAERELDSGVASQTSGMFSPGEGRKNEERSDVLQAMPDGGSFETSAAAYGESAMAVHDSESGQRSLVVPQGCWSGGIEDELPLDSSSLHEEHSEVELPAAEAAEAAAIADEHFTSVEKSEVMDIQSGTSMTPLDVPKCGVEELLILVPPSLSSNPSALKDAKSSVKVLKAEDQGAEDNYQILKLPFESILTPGGNAAGHISPPAGPYYYNYLSMPAAHERMSVLSPSLDELSSRDEMFSTDLDDADLFPKHAYARRRLVEVLSVSPKASEEVEEMWLRGSKRLVCACCGKSLAKVTGRSKALRTYRDREPAADSEEDGQYAGGCERPVRVLVRKHTTPRKPHAVLPRPKPWHKRGPHKDPVDPGSQCEGRDLKQAVVDSGESAAMSGELQCWTCQGTSVCFHFLLHFHFRPPFP